MINSIDTEKAFAFDKIQGLSMILKKKKISQQNENRKKFPRSDDVIFRDARWDACPIRSEMK